MLRRCKAVMDLACMLLAIAGPSATARAQSVEATAAYVSLILTAPGALPPHFTASSITVPSYGYEVSVRYGERGGLTASRNAGVGVEFGLGEERWGGVIGVAKCAGCDDAIMLGVNFSTALAGPSALQRGPTLTARLAGSSNLGAALNGDFVVVATTAELPLLFATTISSGATGPRLALYAIPSGAYGVLTCDDDCSASGFRFAFGAGVGLLRVGRMDATVGVNKIFIKNGETLVGVSLAWRSVP